MRIVLCRELVAAMHGVHQHAVPLLVGAGNGEKRRRSCA